MAAQDVLRHRQAYKDSKVCDVMLMKELHRRFHKAMAGGVAVHTVYRCG